MTINDLDELKRVKELVGFAMQANQDNIDSFKKFKRFVFRESLYEDDKRNLQDLNLPMLTANTLEPFLDRFYGEFSQNPPEPTVCYDNTEDPNKKALESFMDDEIRGIIKRYEKKNFDNIAIKDMTAGGFCVFDWGYRPKNPYTFQQEIYVNTKQRATLCGSDPNSKTVDKSDGKFVFEIYPLTPQDIRDQFKVSDQDLISFKFPDENKNFQWSYSIQNKDKTKIIYVCVLYEKKFKSFELLLLEDGQELTAADYKEKYGDIVMSGDEDSEFEDEGEKEQTQEALQELQEMQNKPKVVQKRREQEVDYIEKITFIENRIFKREKTIYKNVFPLVWGDSGKGYWEEGKWVTRPYFYNAIDTQRLKNIALNQLADELTNVRKTDILMPEAALPQNEDYLQPYINPNFRGGVMVYRHKSENPLPSGLPDQIPPPTVIPKAQIPQDFIGLLDRTQQMQQNQLGAYDASIGINDNQLSGKALDSAIPQSNLAAKPIITAYIAAWNKILEGVIDIIPKVHVTPFTRPLMIDDKQHYISFNTPEGVSLDYNVFEMQVELKEGSSFENSKKAHLELLATTSNAFPAIKQIVNSPQGLPIVLQNFDFKGSDKLREIAEQQALKPPPAPPNPELMKAQADMTRAQAEMIQKQLDQKRLQLDVDKFEEEKKKNLFEAVNKRQESHQEEQRIKLEAQADKTAASLEKRQQDMDSHHRSLDRVADYDKFHKDKMVDLTKTAISSIGNVDKGE